MVDRAEIPCDPNEQTPADTQAGYTVEENPDGTLVDIVATGQRASTQASNSTTPGSGVSSGGGVSGSGGGDGPGGKGGGSQTAPPAKSPQRAKSPPPPQDPRCSKVLRGGGTVNDNVRYVQMGTAMMQQTGNPNAGITMFLIWLQDVAPGGAWDYKKNGGNSTDDEMGNFNFGATGNTFLNPATILSGAGAVQLLTNPSGSDGGFPGISPPYGDDIQGQQEISDGINGGCG